MRLLLSVLALSVCGVTAHAAPARLVVGGQGRATIVLPEKPSVTERFAADEFTRYVKAMGGAALHAVVVSECFEDREYKEKLLAGIGTVVPKDIVLGGATYGSFTQTGCTDFDAVCLMGLGGDGLSVSAGLVTEMGTSKLTYEDSEDLIRDRLHAAGSRLTANLRKDRKTDKDRLCILIPDAC